MDGILKMEDGSPNKFNKKRSSRRNTCNIHRNFVFFQYTSTANNKTVFRESTLHNIGNCSAFAHVPQENTGMV